MDLLTEEEGQVLTIQILDQLGMRQDRKSERLSLVIVTLPMSDVLDVMNWVTFGVSAPNVPDEQLPSQNLKMSGDLFRVILEEEAEEEAVAGMLELMEEVEDEPRIFAQQRYQPWGQKG